MTHTQIAPVPVARSVRDVRPLGIHVYERLRSMIVAGALVGDSQVVQERVADELGVSRTPVREALSRLSHEGLVSWIAGVGYVVNALTDHDIADVLQVRGALEPLAISAAVDRYTPADMSAAAALIEQMARFDATDADAHFELNRQFHRLMSEPCGNALLIKMLDDLWNQPINRRITAAYVRIDGNVARMVEEHRQILAAAVAGDRESMLRLTGEHLDSGYSATMRGID